MSVSLHYEIASSEPSTAYTGLQSAKTLKTRFGSVPSAKRLRAQKRSTFPLEWSYKETYKTLSFSGLGIIPITKDFLHRFTSGAAIVSLQFSKKITEIPSDPATAFIAVFLLLHFFFIESYISILKCCSGYVIIASILGTLKTCLCFRLIQPFPLSIFPKGQMPELFFNLLLA